MTIRPEFESPSNQNIKEWRLFIAGQLRRSREARSYFDRGDGDWNRLIDNLEKPGVYENDCGDLILPTIAHCFCVDLIVFNTKKTSVPFTPVSSTMWGGPQSSKPPLLLVYDDNHYEIVLPATREDSLLTKELVRNWMEGDFNITHEDMKSSG